MIKPMVGGKFHRSKPGKNILILLKSRETKKGDVRPKKDLARPQRGLARLKMVS